MISKFVRKFRSLFSRKKVILIHRWSNKIKIVPVDTSGQVLIAKLLGELYILRPDGSVCGDEKVLCWGPYKGFTYEIT